MDIDAVVQEKIESDQSFLDSIANLPDTDREVAISEKREELIKQEFASIAEKAAKAEQIAKDQKTRAEKAEEEAKKLKTSTPTPEPAKDADLSPRDVLALTGRGITHEEDIQLAQKWAKVNGVTVGEVLKDKDFQIALGARQEERQTAETTQAKGGFRGAAKVSGDELLRQAEKGKIPESDADIEKLAAARLQNKIAEAQASRR